MPNPRNLNYVLASIGQTLKNFSSEWKMDVPPIQALVVNKGTRIPGEGISSFISEANYKKLSRRQQRALVDSLLVEIYTFPEWGEVLDVLGLESPQQDFSEFTEAAAFGGLRGGEGPQHEAFKQLVASNPSLVGIKGKIVRVETEHNLPSGDRVDVQVFTRKGETSIEVKSAISNVADVSRGLYQCIKYLAVVEARQAAQGNPQNANAVLALESSLPNELIPLKNILGIDVIENVGVNGS